MTRNLKAAALAALLWPAAAAAELRQKLDVKIQQRYQNTLHSAPSAIPLEYGEIPNGFVVERYALDYESPNYGLGAALSNVGKNNQSILLEGGIPGCVDLKAGWDQMPHLFSNEARSLFVNLGGGVMSLPDALQSFHQTNAATFNADIRTSLDSAAFVPLGFNVETGNMDLRLRPARDLTVSLGGWRQSRRGTKAQPASFGFSNAIELSAPIDWTTNEAYLDLELGKREHQLAFNYRYSEFNNKIPNLFWDNPKRLADQYINASHYSAGDGGARGALANAPNNKAHALKLEGGVNLPKDARLSVEGGYQRWTSFTPMLPYTQNTQMNPGNASAAAAGLKFPAFDPDFRPDPNVEGLMDVYTYMAKLSGRPLPGLRAALTHDAYILQSNGPKYVVPGWAVMDQVWHDERVETPREGIRDDKTSVKLDYDLTRQLSGNLGLQHKYMKVTREISKSREDEANAGLTFRPSRDLRVNLGYLLALRRGNGMDLQHYPTARDTGGRLWFTEAPGMRRADIADRNRNQGRLLAQWTHGENSVSFSARITEDKYRPGKGSLNGDDPLIYAEHFGTLSDLQEAVGVDVSFPVLKGVTLDAYYEHDFTKRMLRASQTQPANTCGGTGTTAVLCGSPDYRWTTRLTDNSDVGGAQLTWTPGAKLKAVVGYDIVSTRFNGTPQSAGSKILNYRAFETSKRMQQTARARGEYKLLENLTVAANYLYEKFDAADFAYKNVPLRDASNASIFLGAAPIRNYYAHTIAGGLSYRF